MARRWNASDFRVLDSLCEETVMYAESVGASRALVETIKEEYEQHHYHCVIYAFTRVFEPYEELAGEHVGQMLIPSTTFSTEQRLSAWYDRHSRGVKLRDAWAEPTSNGRLAFRLSKARAAHERRAARQEARTLWV